MRYTIYADLDMTKVRKEIDTQNPETIAAMHDLLRSGGIYEPEKLQLPFRFDMVGVVIHEV